MYKMVVIDDEYLVRIGIKETIDWSEYDIEIVGTAKNGREGMALIKEVNPDLIISDVKMPIMDGVELLNELAKNPIDANIIMLSGYKDFDYAKNSLENGAYSYLLKPIDNEALVKCVCDALQDLKEKRIQQEKLLNFDKEVPLIKSTIMQKLLTGDFKLSEILEKNEQFKFSFPENGFVVIAKVDKDTTIVDKELVKKSITVLHNIIIKKLDEKNIQYSDILLFSHCVFLIKEENNELIYNTFIEIINEYDNDLSYVSVAISDKYLGLSNINDKYVEAKKLIKNKLAISANTVATSNDSYTNYREEVNKTMNYIVQNYQQNISVKIVANYIGISESHLMHILKEEVGKTFNEILTEYRIKVAKALLASPNYHIYDVGLMVGYNDQKYFRKIFFKVTGEMPTDYRKRVNK